MQFSRRVAPAGPGSGGVAEIRTAMGSRAGALGIALVALLSLGGLACSGTPKPVEACLVITSGTNLHTYDGQPHVLPLYIYALSSSLEFQQMDVTTLLGSDMKPDGVVGGPLELIVAPDQVVEFREALDPKTTQIGIVADYYRQANDPPGQRKVVVEAGCGMFGTPSVRLTPTDLLVE